MSRSPAPSAADDGRKRITLTAGVYRITMVEQAPDDNHLKLVVE